LLQKFNGKFTTASTLVINAHLTTTVFTKDGQQVSHVYVNPENAPLTLDRELSKEERADKALVNRLVIEKLIAMTLKQFEVDLAGGNTRSSIRLAELKSVKKLPELQEFSKQVKQLVPVVEKEGLTGLARTAQPFVPYWETMAAYTGNDKADEVKRAAYQNLALYHLASNNLDKAQEYIALYKPIDKTISELFGLVKYKNSDVIEKYIDSLKPATAAIIPTTDKQLTKAQMVDTYSNIIINGTAKVTSKREAGTYTGQIRVSKLPPAGSFGSIVSLDPENIAVTITGNDANGQAKSFQTTVSKLENIIDNNGTAYTVQKFGVPMLGDGTYFSFMQTTYTSPKIQVYRSILPVGKSDYLVKKAADDKGVKSALLNGRKNLEEYLSDCPSLAEQFKTGTVKNESLEKLAERYSTCQ
jgi:hypothetical protein